MKFVTDDRPLSTESAVVFTTLRVLLTLVLVAPSIGGVPSGSVSAPIQVPSHPRKGESWEDLRALHVARASFWVAAYDAQPTDVGLRDALDEYEDWIDGLFDQRAIRLAAPLARRLEASLPRDIHGIWLVARFMNFEQRFADETTYLIPAIELHPTASVLWTELGNALACRGFTSEPDAYAIAAALRRSFRLASASETDLARFQRFGAGGE